MPPKFSLGVDFGTNSVRALIVDTRDGTEVGTAVYVYPHGEAGILLDPRNPLIARQCPQDYIDGTFKSIAGAIRDAKKSRPDFQPEMIVGIGVDTTASTPMPIDRSGTPLGCIPELADEPAANAWLWKDHSSHEEAETITAKAAKQAEQGGPDYLAKCGGRYSSEWFWSKIWHCKRENPKVFKAAYSWIELADFIPAYLTGNTDPHTLPRGICTAGHKAMFHESWGGLPGKDYLKSLDPALAPIRDRYAEHALTSDQIAGYLTASAAKACRLVPGIPVAVGTIDAHSGAVGAGVKAGTLVKIMGTSTCDLMVHPLNDPLTDIPGLCGIVPGSAVPGMYGLEAGQSAVGDIFNWFVKYLTPSAYTTTGDPHVHLSQAAAQLRPGESGLVALDWNNGNRSVLTNPLLTGLLLGQTLHTTAPEIYRALIEATAFGALTIINRLEEYGVRVKEVINCGGIAEKSPLTMQIYADVCNRPMKISRSAQTCALGAAIFGAIVGGVYKNVAVAQKKMTGVKETIYRPVPSAVRTYAKLYGHYKTLHDLFGGCENAATVNRLMEDLSAIRHAARHQ